MTVTKGFALLISLTLAGAWASASGPAAGLATSTPRLTSISSRVHSKGASLVIEANAPVPYVATRPDPLTILVDFRNVGAEGLANSVAASSKSPIASVAVEPADAMGAPASRVRISLVQAVAHHIRADRNTVVVDLEKPSPKAAPYVLPPVSRSDGSDAMHALEQDRSGRTGDPITVLGLDQLPQLTSKPDAPVPGTPASAATTSPRGTPGMQIAASAAARLQAPAQPSQSPGAQLPAAGDQPGSSRGGRQYTGHPISLDFQGADLRAVLRVFAEESGLNVVIDPAVQGTVDVALHDVPWDQALDIILRANKLGYVVDGTIVRIAPLTVLADEESQRRKLTDEQALAGELRVLTKTLSYAKADELQSLLTKSALSPRGTVQVDPRTNTLIVSDLADRLTLASELIATLDRPQPQVEIEARIVQANKNYARALGVQWGFGGRLDPTLGNTLPVAFPNNGSLTGRTGGSQGPAGNGPAAVPNAVSLAVPAATSAVGLALGSINGAFNLDIALSALESSGNLRVLSTPRVSTQNNIEAEVAQGIQIPIQTIANNTVTVTFKDAVLTLKVTPQITSAGTVIMKIGLENAQADFSRAVNGIPPINTQRATTTVLVSDGQTTVIGGIYVSQEQVANDRTPGLSRVPLFGWLFKRDTLNDTSTELLIFITPKIIKG
jgi:type IV pilus assembly protein PilQ